MAGGKMRSVVLLLLLYTVKCEAEDWRVIENRLSRLIDVYINYLKSPHATEHLTRYLDGEMRKNMKHLRRFTFQVGKSMRDKEIVLIKYVDLDVTDGFQRHKIFVPTPSLVGIPFRNREIFWNNETKLMTLVKCFESCTRMFPVPIEDKAVMIVKTGFILEFLHPVTSNYYDGDRSYNCKLEQMLDWEHMSDLVECYITPQHVAFIIHTGMSAYLKYAQSLFHFLENQVLLSSLSRWFPSTEWRDRFKTLSSLLDVKRLISDMKDYTLSYMLIDENEVEPYAYVNKNAVNTINLTLDCQLDPFTFIFINGRLSMSYTLSGRYKFSVLNPFVIEVEKDNRVDYLKNYFLPIVNEKDCALWTADPNTEFQLTQHCVGFFVTNHTCDDSQSHILYTTQNVLSLL